MNVKLAALLPQLVEQQAIDTNTPSGKMLFQMLGVFSEFEREIIRERIIAGQQRVALKGSGSVGGA